MSNAPKVAKAADKSKGSGSDEPFSFPSSLKDDDGEQITITVPSLAVMKRPNQFKLLRLQKQDHSGVDSTEYLLRHGLGDELMELLEELPGEESDEFMKQWTEHSGVSLGESRAS